MRKVLVALVLAVVATQSVALATANDFGTQKPLLTVTKTAVLE